MKLSEYLNDPVCDYLLVACLLSIIKSDIADDSFSVLSIIYIIMSVADSVFLLVYVLKKTRRNHIIWSYLFSSIFYGMIPLMLILHAPVSVRSCGLILIILSEIIGLAFVVKGILPIFASNDKE